MKIAIVTEISTAHRNQDVYNALCEATKDMGHEIINIGMHGPDETVPEELLKKAFKIYALTIARLMELDL